MAKVKAETESKADTNGAYVLMSDNKKVIICFEVEDEYRYVYRLDVPLYQTQGGVIESWLASMHQMLPANNSVYTRTFKVSIQETK